MPRTARASAGGICYHVLNRTNDRSPIFMSPGDFDAFQRLLEEARSCRCTGILAFCLMPNHFHLVLRPDGDGDLGRFQHWLLTSHAARQRAYRRLTGHLWQGRTRSFPIQQDLHLLAVLRYVERNPLRAGLVSRAEDWSWSSLRLRYGHSGDVRLVPSPVDLGPNWLAFVNRPQTAAELATLRACTRRGTPYGDERWSARTAEDLGLQSSLRPVGRPRKRAVVSVED